MAGNGKYWTRIVPKRIVKLVVIMVRFADAVNDVSQVKEKGGTIHRVRGVEIVA
jgi:hypothetical protein